jgi:hypothetical protein
MQTDHRMNSQRRLLFMTAIGFMCYVLYQIGWEDFIRALDFGFGNRYADDYMWEMLKGDFVAMMGLFMSLPMLFPCCITPT